MRYICVMQLLPALLPRPGRRYNPVPLPVGIFAGLVIYSTAIPLFILDLWVQVYHAIYFPLLGLPPVPRHEFVIIDRGRLARLTLMQKINCVYCDYANGVVAWMKAVVNTTEAYSCAIKHSTRGPGQEHHDGYYDYEKYR